MGEHIKYMPMGYFGDHNLENLTSVVTTTMGDIENNASTVLTNILGGHFPAKTKGPGNTSALLRNIMMTILYPRRCYNETCYLCMLPIGGHHFFMSDGAKTAFWV